jgi:hypothetical protein
MTNPYASFLAGLDPVETIGATPERLRSLLQTIGPARVEEPRAPGKWSPREIVCHLADCEIAFAFRLRQALAEERHVMQPFDQEKWAKSYGAYKAEEALAAFTALRRWNEAFLKGLRPADFGRGVNHPERGDMTLRTIVETMGGHDLNHLQQLESVAGKTASR